MYVQRTCNHKIDNYDNTNPRTTYMYSIMTSHSVFITTLIMNKTIHDGISYVSKCAVVCLSIYSVNIFHHTQERLHIEILELQFLCRMNMWRNKDATV